MAKKFGGARKMAEGGRTWRAKEGIYNEAMTPDVYANSPANQEKAMRRAAEILASKGISPAMALKLFGGQQAAPAAAPSPAPASHVPTPQRAVPAPAIATPQAAGLGAPFPSPPPQPVPSELNPQLDMPRMSLSGTPGILSAPSDQYFPSTDDVGGFMPKQKEGFDWKQLLAYAGLGGLMGQSGINPAAAGIMGGMLPLIGELLKKQKAKKTAAKTAPKEEKAKGGPVMKKFGGASKAAPKPKMKMPKAAPMPPMTMPKMGCGGKVKKMATGGMVCRGMGAAKKGGGYKAC